MKKINTIIFDLDGTLINTNNIIIESFKEVFRVHNNNQIPTYKEILSFIGPTLQQTFNKYTNNQSKVDEMIKTYRSFYVDYEVGNHKLYPNVLEVLTKLKNQGYKLAILTSKFNEAAWPSFTHYELEKLFDVFVGLDDVPNAKPHKDAVNTVLSHFPDCTGAIMVGDNKSDILAGKNAGIFGVGVAWSIKGSDYLKEAKPDFMLENMNDIFKVIELIEKGE